MNLDKKYEKWLENQTFEEVDENELRKEIIDELTFLSSMGVEEYSLYTKWIQLNEKYGEKTQKKEIDNLNVFFTKSKSNTGIEILDIVKNSLWIPKNPNDYKNLDVEVVWINGDSYLTKIWNCMRDFCTTLVNNSNVGRNLGFIIRDKITQKLLGCITISSDFMDLSARDNFIKWSKEVKTDQKMINHTCIGSTIIPTQPLGFSYVGGKLIALLTISEVIENTWNQKYNDKLVGITTTSLYGSFSQYNGLKHWKKVGRSAGKILYKPSTKSVKKIKSWLKRNHSKKYWEWYFAERESGLPLKRNFIQRSFNFTYSKFKIDKNIKESNHERGIYFCELFENTKEFLKKEIDENQLVRKFDNSVENLVELWKKKYAEKRVNSILKDGRYTKDILFYDDLIGMEWNEVKEKYLKQVGR
jgi:hypothetical protein